MTDDIPETTMTARIARGSQSSYARLAGLMYFFTAFDFAGVVILSRVSGSGSFLGTAHSIAASETLYRIGLLCGLVGTMSTVLLAIGLYVTLKPVDGNLAITALLFRLAESIIGGVALLFSFANLQIYLEANHHSAFDAGQLGALADLVSRMSAVGINISVIFFAVGSTIFFYLFLKSAYIPRFLALWGVLGSLFCMAAFVVNLLLPQSSDALLGLGGLPIGIAEPVLGLWLLIRGINIHAHALQTVG
jgi:hypothetical protein